MVKDLVCGMKIEEAKSRATYDFEGRTKNVKGIQVIMK